VPLSQTYLPDEKKAHSNLLSQPSCEFSARNSAGEAFRVVVDDEIYRTCPSLIVATVDKFARLPSRARLVRFSASATASALPTDISRRRTRTGRRPQDPDAVLLRGCSRNSSFKTTASYFWPLGTMVNYMKPLSTMSHGFKAQAKRVLRRK
jgi:hypothetical protein